MAAGKKKSSAEAAPSVKIDGSATVSLGKKSFSVSKENGSLELTNEYGNSLTFPLDGRGFEAVWSQLWQMVKDSQH